MLLLESSHVRDSLSSSSLLLPIRKVQTACESCKITQHHNTRGWLSGSFLRHTTSIPSLKTMHRPAFFVSLFLLWFPHHNSIKFLTSQLSFPIIPLQCPSMATLDTLPRCKPSELWWPFSALAEKLNKIISTIWFRPPSSNVPIIAKFPLSCSYSSYPFISSFPVRFPHIVWDVLRLKKYSLSDIQT